jgi:hypothetical protein
VTTDAQLSLPKQDLQGCSGHPLAAAVVFWRRSQAASVAAALWLRGRLER